VGVWEGEGEGRKLGVSVVNAIQ